MVSVKGIKQSEAATLEGHWGKILPPPSIAFHTATGAICSFKACFEVSTLSFVSMATPFWGPDKRAIIFLRRIGDKVSTLLLVGREICLVWQSSCRALKALSLPGDFTTDHQLTFDGIFNSIFTILLYNQSDITPPSQRAQSHPWRYRPMPHSLKGIGILFFDLFQSDLFVGYVSFHSPWTTFESHQ